MYYLVEGVAKRKGSDEALWARSGSYSWAQLLERAHQYGRWLLSQGVKPGDLVAFMMINSTDFIAAWLGLWAIGAAPAMINYNLKGKALVHCLKISTAKLVLVDGGLDIHSRIGEVEPDFLVEGFKFAKLDQIRDVVYSCEPTRPRDELRKDIVATSPMALFYTRSEHLRPPGSVSLDDLLTG